MTFSIIICTRASTIPDALAQNIRDTITLPEKTIEYEIIIINNQNNKYSLFEAYNIGVKKSSGEILCFMHDDIEYLNKGWGNKVVRLFSEEPSVGACAVAGCTVLRKSPALFGIGKYNAINIQKQDGQWLDQYSTPTPLATFDGVWFCVRRVCFNTISFDQYSYSGFHFYDMDTAMQIHSAGYSIMFIPDIPIRHASGGAINIEWLKNSFIFYQKYKNKLPYFSSDERPNSDEMIQYELTSIYTSLRLIILYRQWGLIKKWWDMAKETLRCPQPKATFWVLKHHLKKDK